MADPDAVRQVRERARDREVSIWNSADGMGEVYAQLYATDAQALDARLNALVATVCAGDPRSTDQRRADALGALAAGRIGWPAAARTPATGSGRAAGAAG